MPIQKFKNFDDASKSLWNYTPDNNYYQRVRRFYKFSSRLIKFTCARGIYKFSSFKEAEEHRMEFLLTNVSQISK